MALESPCVNHVVICDENCIAGQNQVGQISYKAGRHLDNLTPVGHRLAAVHPETCRSELRSEVRIATAKKCSFVAQVPMSDLRSVRLQCSAVLDREVLLFLLAAFFLRTAIEPRFCSLGIGKCKALYCE